MTIKEVEARTGLTRANIRYYEGEGFSAWASPSAAPYWAVAVVAAFFYLEIWRAAGSYVVGMRNTFAIWFMSIRL